MDGFVVRRLREAQGWLMLQQFLDYAVLGLLAGLSAFAFGRAASANFPKIEVSFLVAIVCPLALAALVGLFRWRSMRAVARELDARGKTKDRFLTALTLPVNQAGDLSDAARQETAAFASTFRVRDHLRLRPPGKKALWLLIPAAALALLESVQIWHANHIAPELATARRLIEQAWQAAELEAKEDRSFQEIAEQLQTAERHLAASREPLREALRTLANLEEKVSAQAELDATDTNALAEALDREHKQLASDLRAGRKEDAARAVAQLDPAELAKALEEAARHLETRRLQELAHRDPAAAKTQLMMMLGSLRGESNVTGQRRFIAALRDIKSGAQGADPYGVQGPKDAEAAPGSDKSTASTSDGAPPTGQPGSENDLGRGSDIVEEAQAATAPPGTEDFVAGEIGEGASLVEIFRAAGNDDPRAQRAYRSAHQIATAAALDAVSREQIPTGSRLLVLRYFEGIRPKE